MDASALASATQSGSSLSYSVDCWRNVKLQPLTKLWQGIGGDTNFFLSERRVYDFTGRNSPF